MTYRLKQGLVQIYTGEGKGKTTAALGLALRATGQGLRVIFIQFLKGIPAGEHRFTAQYHPFEIIQLSQGDCFQKTTENLAIESGKTIKYAREQMLSGKYDVVILDEIFVAMKQGFIEQKDILELIQSKPKNVELILTGRDAPAAIKRKADLITEMRMIKHPYTKGIKGRKGIEF